MRQTRSGRIVLPPLRDKTAQGWGTLILTRCGNDEWSTPSFNKQLPGVPHPSRFCEGVGEHRLQRRIRLESLVNPENFVRYQAFFGCRLPIEPQIETWDTSTPA